MLFILLSDIFWHSIVTLSYYYRFYLEIRLITNHNFTMLAKVVHSIAEVQ